MAGRPKRTADLALLNDVGAARVEELLEQALPLETICKELKVSKRALYAWLDAPEQSGLLSRARARAADHLAAETIEIADTVAEDPAAIAKARLRTDTRKWLASKWDQARYGDAKGVQVNINLADLHLEAVKTVRPVHGADEMTIEAAAEPRQAVDRGAEGQD
jgi:hypothetical protein